MRLINADDLTVEILTTTFTESNSAGLKLALAMIKEAKTVGGWISVKDRLPENTGLYLTYCKGFSDGRSFYRLTEYSAEHRGWFEWVRHKYNTEDSCVVWWMPLPEPPKEENYDQL